MKKIIFALAIAVVIGGVYLYKQQDGFVSTPSNDSSAITFEVQGNSLSVINNGKNIQTISLEQDAIKALPLAGNIDVFLTNLDVNFDGQNDVGVFASTGYAGVNTYYDFYIYNSQDKRFEKSDSLTEISNPTVNPAAKQVRSSYRSGPQWYQDTFEFNGNTYTKVGDGISQ